MPKFIISEELKKPQIVFTVILSLALLGLTVFGQAKIKSDLRPLTIKKPIERKLKGGETHSYSLTLHSGQFLRVIVKQKGIDVTVLLFDPADNQIREVDSPNGMLGQESLYAFIEKNGDYRLEIRSGNENAPSGQYSAKIAEYRELQKTDEIRIAAQIAFDEGEKLRKSKDPKSRLKSVEEYKKALTNYRNLGDEYGEALTQFLIGFVYNGLGEKPTALDFYKQALQIFRSLKDKQFEGVTLNNIGRIHEDLGEKGTALDFFEQALLIRREVGDKEGEGATLNNIGSIYHFLGEIEKSLGFLKKAIPLRRKAGDKPGVVKTLSNIGTIYVELNKKKKAFKYLNQALQLLTENNKYEKANILNSLGGVYSNSGEKQKALEYYKDALSLHHGNLSGEVLTLNNIGVVYLELYAKQKSHEYLQKSHEYLQKALLLSKSFHFKEGEEVILGVLMVYWKLLNNPDLAIFYGKQSVNILQELRSNISSLDKELQKSYLKSIEINYRFLAEILIAEGRIAEAEHVLEMLKETEFFEFLRRDDKVAKELRKKIKLTPSEEEAFKCFEEIADEITRIGREFYLLEMESKKFDIGKFPHQAKLDQLDAQLTAARKVFNKFLEQLDSQFRNRDTQQQDIRLAEVSSTQALLDKLNQPRTVIISTIVGKDRLNIIVTTAKISRAHSIEIKAADLNNLVLEFRKAVKNPSVEPRLLGRQLYDILFPAALQKDLDGVKADTIVWSLDGTLRYAPISALWDGKQYLAERYANAVITLASRDKIDNGIRDNWTALGVGVSKEFEEFPALSAVPEELCRVVDDPQKRVACQNLTRGKQGIISGVNLSDEEFTFQAFKLHLGRYKLVHIASHFSLNPGTEKDSYLLLGGGTSSAERKLTLATVRENLDTKFVGTELLTLSACNTAMTAGVKSSGAEIEGFGVLAQKQGAKTVLASLWAVVDPSTRDLMTEFYQILSDPNVGKAEALRQSQIIVLNGEYSTEEAAKKRGTEIIHLDNTTKTQPTFRKDAKAPFAHPYYWSPFVLIGNWR